MKVPTWAWLLGAYLIFKAPKPLEPKEQKHLDDLLKASAVKPKT